MSKKLGATLDKAMIQRVEDYMGLQPEPVRVKLEKVRDAIRRAVPEAVEGIGYGMPRYKLHGKPLVHFAVFQQHYSLFAASASLLAALGDELAPYDVDKGTIRFPLGKPVPVKLIEQIAKLRAKEIAETAEPGRTTREKAKSKAAS